MQLFAFDFDQTIINLNSDIVIRDKLEILPPELEEIHKKQGWIGYMQKVFDILHDNNATLEDLSSTVKTLECVPGMRDLINHLSEVGHDMIIISDANSYFIDTWLEHNNLKDKILKTFTNPADTTGGRLLIGPYHQQSHCKLSSKNLCKGQVLEDFINDQKSKGIVYEKLNYVGDGANDVCPILRLKENDVAFVRENYKCEALIKGNKSVKAKVIIWRDGNDILNHVE